MKTCPQCARNYPDSETFCEDDGAKLNAADAPAGRATTLMADSDAPAEGEIECPVCGGKAQPGEVICNFCGTRLAPDDAAGAAAGASASATRRPPRQSPETFVPASEHAASRSFQTTPIRDSTAQRGGDDGRGILGTFGFIVAAIIALIAGGLFALYLSHRNQPPAPIAAASPSPSPAAVASPVVVLAKTIPLQVSGDLAGSLQRDPKTLAKAFDDNSAGMLNAYRNALDSTPGLSDGMLLRLHIMPDGSVSDGSVRVSTAPNPSLDAEVVKLAGGWKFGTAAGTGVDADYPVVFATSSGDVAGIESDLKTKVASLGPNEAPEYALTPASPSPAAAEASPAASPGAAPPPGVAAVGPPGSEAFPPSAEASPSGRHRRRSATGLASVRPSEPPLRERIDSALATNRKLRRVQVYTTGGNVTMFGKVFDDNDRRLAEESVRGVRGVTSVTDNLTTDTGEWAQNANVINQQLQNAGLGGVTAKVIGRTAYLSGTVKSQLDKDRAVGIAQSAAHVIVRENLIRVDAGGLF